MLRRCSLAVLLCALIPCTLPAARDATMPATLDEAVAWLHVTSFEMIRAASRTMADGTTAFPPQTGRGYGGFWLRDYEYMLEGHGEAFTHEELRAACRLFVRAQRDDGAMVDTVKFDGTPIYMPGWGTYGENPVADGAQFTVGVAWHTWRLTRDAALVREIVDPLVHAMRFLPRNPETGLVHIKPGGWDRAPYGFTDSVAKQGDVLFCSLLDVEASGRLAELLRVAGRGREAREWDRHARRVADSVRSVFWDDETGLFRAATLQCREHDIWGSAFAVRLDVATPWQARRIATYFRDHYGEIVQRGQLRHLPGGVHWESVRSRKDVYQNGAYWAAPVGWFVYTLDLVDPALADRTVIDMVRDFIATGDVNECVNHDYRNVPGYVVSAALPLEGIRAMQARRRGQR